MAEKKKKVRTELRKNRTGRTRLGDWTRRFQSEGDLAGDQVPTRERIGKDELSRKRTVLGSEAAENVDLPVFVDVDASLVRRGRVLSVSGLRSSVAAEDGTIHSCATRRLLRTLSTDQRHVIAAGDNVLFRPSGDGEGVIERIEPRHGVLSRTSRGRHQVIVANVDQVLIVGSAAEPTLKPNLIDRYLISAHQSGLRPLIAINKLDLVDPASLQPLAGLYCQMGYQVLLLSAHTKLNIDRLRTALAGRATAVVGQSGVGKSSLLNAVDPQLHLRVGEVSRENQKGCHTTTTARLWPLAGGGYVVDTPGIRQFQLWDIISQEVAGNFRDLRPYVNLCKFPNCTHTHENACAVKDAVADGRLDVRRYESYCCLLEGDDP
jgi:ribosome biogenesis GTPase